MCLYIHIQRRIFMLNSDLMNRIACLKKVVDAMFQDDAPEVGQALNFCINLIFYKEEMKEINQTLSVLDEIKDIKNIYSSLKDKKNAQ